MPLIQSVLQSDLNALFDAMKDAPMSEADFAVKLAAIIDHYIKTATVTVNPGIAVATPVGPGSTTGQGTGNLT